MSCGTTVQGENEGADAVSGVNNIAALFGSKNKMMRAKGCQIGGVQLRCVGKNIIRLYYYRKPIKLSKLCKNYHLFDKNCEKNDKSCVR